MTCWRNTLMVVCCIVSGALFAGAETLPSANLDPAYKALRALKPTGESLTLDKVVLKRDAGTFILSGQVCFTPPVEGRVTGAVFTGTGTFSMEPPLKIEQVNLSRLTGQPRIDEDFEDAVLRFSDATYDELKKSPGAKAAQGACKDSYWNEIERALRKEISLSGMWNLSARLLQDVYSSNAEGMFAAFINGKKYSDKEVYVVAPHGAPVVAPEEVLFMSWAWKKSGYWAAFHRSSEYASRTATSAERNAVSKVEKQEVDLTIQKSGHLGGKASTTFVARQDGIRVFPFDLYPTLRVTAVTDQTGQKLNFIQEDKEEDSDFWVILPQPLKAGEKYTIVTSYGGDDALLNTGGGNYYLNSGARHSWYPGGRMEDYATYDMRFTFPKGATLIASGRLEKETTEGGQTTARWVSEEPQTVAAFQLGRFKKEARAVSGLPNLSLETYANQALPDWLADLQRQQIMQDQAHSGIMESRGNQIPLESLSTTSMMKKAVAEADASAQIFTKYFGPTPFKRLAMTQQTADNFGQSWPQLVWLPLSYFLDDTYRHQIYGFDPRGYFTAVAPHEIAHQWWGHTVTWASYRDQWMSEGFSDASASIFLQIVGNGDNSRFLKFWNDEHSMLTERNKEGFRAIDAGPVTLGYRLDNARTGGNITRDLIYAKGAYILHMIRMMMWSARTGDQEFMALMQDFAKTYRGKAATTEDFKAMVEKHMLPTMDLAGNRKMDWFFDQYVYGTALPNYRLEYSISGKTLSVNVTQSGVDNSFMMRVPLYLEFADGKTTRLGSVVMVGNNSVQQKVDLGQMGWKDMPKRVLLAHYADVLADKIEQPTK